MNGKNIMELLLTYSGQENDQRAIDFMTGIYKSLPKDEVFKYNAPFKWMRGNSKVLLKCISQIDFLFISSVRGRVNPGFRDKFTYNSRIIAYDNLSKEILINDWYMGILPMSLIGFYREFAPNELVTLEKFNNLVSLHPVKFLHSFSHLTRPTKQAHIFIPPN